MRLLASLLLVSACTVEPPAAPPPIEAPVPPVAPREAPAGGPAEVVPDPAGANAELSQALEHLGAIIRATQAGARDAAEAAEGDACTKARASMLGAVAAATQAFADHPLDEGRRPPTWSVAPEARYLSLCHALPEPLQRCARLDHRTSPASGCRQVLEAATPEQQASLDEMAHPARL